MKNIEVITELQKLPADEEFKLYQIEYSGGEWEDCWTRSSFLMFSFDECEQLLLADGFKPDHRFSEQGDYLNSRMDADDFDDYVEPYSAEIQEVSFKCQEETD